MMPTPAKTTPAKATSPAAESAASVASRVAPLDLKSLAPRPSKVPEVRRTVADRDNSIVESWVKSLETERGTKPVSPAARDLPITLGQVGEIRTRLNEAGAKLGAGIGIRLLDKDNKEVNIPALLKELKDKKRQPGESYTLKFWTQTRRKTKKTTQGTTPAATGDAGEASASK